MNSVEVDNRGIGIIGKKASRRDRTCLILLILFFSAPFWVLVFCRGFNSLQLYAFSKRFARLEVPSNTHELFSYEYVGTTIYNSDYCHYITGKYFETGHSLNEIKNFYQNRKAKGTEGKFTNVHVIGLENDEFKPFNEDDTKFVDEFLSDKLRQQLIAAMEKRGDEPGRNMKQFFVFAENMEMWTFVSIFDIRCL